MKKLLLGATALIFMTSCSGNGASEKAHEDTARITDSIAQVEEAMATEEQDHLESIHQAQSMKMVVNSKGEVVGRYVKTNPDTYTVEVQDAYDVPKEGNKIVIFNAENGEGVIWCKDFGSVNVRSTPSPDGTIIGKLIYEEGLVPETYPCLGKTDGWYKTRIDGKIGYVRSDLVEWDGMDTF